MKVTQTFGMTLYGTSNYIMLHYASHNDDDCRDDRLAGTIERTYTSKEPQGVQKN